MTWNNENTSNEIRRKTDEFRNGRIRVCTHLSTRMHTLNFVCKRNTLPIVSHIIQKKNL